MLTKLPVELLSIITAYGFRSDILNLRLTSRILYTNLAEAFGHRYFRRRTHQHTLRGLKRLLQLSQVASILDEVEQLTIVVVEPLYRDVDALQEPIKARVIKTRAESLLRTTRHNRSDSWPPPIVISPNFDVEWLALQESINEQCATMFLQALANFARAQKLPTLLLRYEAPTWDGYGASFGSTKALARLIGIDASYSGWREPVKILAPVFSMAEEVGYPITDVEIGSGSGCHYWGVSTFEPLMQISPSALTNLRRLTISLTITAADLDNDRNEGLRYLLSLPARLTELNITFCPGDRCFLTSDYMSTLAHCLSDAPLTDLSMTNGHMSSDGLGKLLEPHSGTLRSLKLYYVSFGDDDDPFAMLKQLSAFPMLDTLDLIGLAQRGTDIAIDMETLGSVFSARGWAAVKDLWRKFMGCYCVE
jgi:hypothetical protein